MSRTLPRSNWSVTSVTLTNAGIEYSLGLNTRLLFLSVQCRPDNLGVTQPFRISFNSGESLTNPRTIVPGSAWESHGLIIPALTVYLSSSVAGVIVEVEQWW